jgi:aminomuconate-semialdehyde/2-hydroxymuconate-6-semialdehyde dehydrogenase
LESRDQGKTVGAARMIDIPRAAENFRFFAKVISNPESERTTLSQNARGTQFTAISSTNRMPVGVAGLISPWVAFSSTISIITLL